MSFSTASLGRPVVRRVSRFEQVIGSAPAGGCTARLWPRTLRPSRWRLRNQVGYGYPSVRACPKVRIWSRLPKDAELNESPGVFYGLITPSHIRYPWPRVGNMKIFLSYRRGSTADITARIDERLRAHFGHDAVFRDIDDIPLGEDFHVILQMGVASADLFVMIIGPEWATTGNLASKQDFVHIELSAALDRGIAIVPVLVRGAKMPREDDLPEALRPLLRRQALEVDSGVDFEHHVERLMRGIESIFQRIEARRRKDKEQFAADAASGAANHPAQQPETRRGEKQGRRQEAERPEPGSTFASAATTGTSNEPPATPTQHNVSHAHSMPPHIASANNGVAARHGLRPQYLVLVAVAAAAILALLLRTSSQQQQAAAPPIASEPASPQPGAAEMPPPNLEPKSASKPRSEQERVLAVPGCEGADWSDHSLPALLKPGKSPNRSWPDQKPTTANAFYDECSDNPRGRPKVKLGAVVVIGGIELRLTNAEPAGSTGRGWEGNQCSFEVRLAGGSGRPVKLGPEQIPPFTYITSLARAGSAAWLQVAFNGYTSAFQKGGNRVIAVDLCDGTVAWKSADSTANGGLLLLKDYLISSYGFTSERRFVYVLDAHSGGVIQKLRVVENQCPSKSWAPNWNGGSCDAPGQLVGAADSPRVEDGLFLVDTNTGSSTFELR